MPANLSTDQLADRWGISKATLEIWRSKGKGPPFLKIGRRVVYREPDIQAYEASNLKQATRS